VTTRGCWIEQGQLRRGAVPAVVLSVLVVAGCGGGSPSAHTTPPVLATAPSAPTTEATGPTLPPIPEADVRPCINVQAVLSHITADTARWSPTSHPFDTSIATRLGTQAGYMNQQAMGGDYALRKAVADTARAFGGVARSIVAHSRKQLAHAVDRSRVAYAALKKLCHYATDS
jgi:hypothetical protein